MSLGARKGRRGLELTRPNPQEGLVGIETSSFSPELLPASAPVARGSAISRFIGGTVKETLTWEKAARYGAIAALAWQLFSMLDGIEKRLSTQIQTLATTTAVEQNDRKRSEAEIMRRLEGHDRLIEELMKKR